MGSRWSPPRAHDRGGESLPQWSWPGKEDTGDVGSESSRGGYREGECCCESITAKGDVENFLSFVLSWVSKTQPNHRTKRMASTRLTA